MWRAVLTRLSLVTLSLVTLSLVSCPKPPKPAAPVKAEGPPRRDVGPLVAMGFTEDRVRPGDASLEPDGDLDFAFRVRISGDVRALVLFGSDHAGKPHGGEVWDTMVGPEKYPAAWHLPYPDARDTWALAIVDGGGKVLNPTVTLPKSTFADETLTLFAADLGHVRFVSGRTYTLFVVRSDGGVDRATTTIL